MTKSSNRVRNLAVSAVFLSIALVFKYFSYDIPLFGIGGVRLSLAGIFSAMPAFLFGPLYGAVVAALTDGIGYALKPIGPYMPLITATAALGGFLRGALWLIIKNADPRRFRAALAVIAAAALLFGSYNMYALKKDGVTADFYSANSLTNMIGVSLIEELVQSDDTLADEYKKLTADENAPHSAYITLLMRAGDLYDSYTDAITRDMSFISALLIKNSAARANARNTLSSAIIMSTWAFIVFGAALFLTAGIDCAASRRRRDKNKDNTAGTENISGLTESGTVRKAKSSALMFFIVLLASGLLVNTLNTVILRQIVYTSWQLFPFAALWLPRAAEELLSCVLYAYAVAALYRAVNGRHAFISSSA